MDKVVIVTSGDDWLAQVLTSEAIKAVNARTDMELVAICLSANVREQRMRYLFRREQLVRVAKKLLRPWKKLQPPLPRPVDFSRLAERGDFQLLCPPDKNINDPGFVQRLQEELKPNVVLSLICIQIFRPELLRLFEYGVNYHNGLLPEYKGLKATAWSVYREESETGYTWHRMDEKIDTGQILLQGSVQVRPDSTVLDLDLEKVWHAASQFPQLFDKISAREEGFVQEGEGSYFSARDARELRRVSAPGELSGHDLQQRLRAFKSLQVEVAGETLEVKGLRPVGRERIKKSARYIESADGILFEVKQA